MGSANGSGLGEMNARGVTSLPDEPGGKNTAPPPKPVGTDPRRKPPPRANRGPQFAVRVDDRPHDRTHGNPTSPCALPATTASDRPIAQTGKQISPDGENRFRRAEATQPRGRGASSRGAISRAAGERGVEEPRNRGAPRRKPSAAQASVRATARVALVQPSHARPTESRSSKSSRPRPPSGRPPGRRS